MSFFEELAATWLEVLGKPPTQRQIMQFARYADLLIEWNTHINLTAITDPKEIVVKHFLDSLSILAALDPIASKPFKLIDVGSGAGFPGMAVAIMRPTWHMTLLDSTRKKVDFLRLVAHELKLNQVTLLWGRAEKLAQQASQREQYHAAVARAVAPLPVLAEYCLPFVSVGGHWVAQKGPKAREEVFISRNAFGQLGGKLRAVETITVPGMADQIRHLIIVKKAKATPRTFPRRPGIPSKRPL